MTCIVAIETPEGVWMGSDRQATDAWQTYDLDSSKMFRNGPALIGACGSIRQGQLLQHALRVPEESLSWDVDRWVSIDLSRAMIEMAEGWRASYVKDNVSRSHNALFAIRGRCYELHSDYCFTRDVRGEYACGSGSFYALGSLHTTRHLGLTAEERVRCALMAACEYDPYVNPPIDIEWQAA